MNAHGYLCALNTIMPRRLVRVERNGHATTFGYNANGNRTHESGQEMASYDSHDRMLHTTGMRSTRTPAAAS